MNIFKILGQLLKSEIKSYFRTHLKIFSSILSIFSISFGGVTQNSIIKPIKYAQRVIKRNEPVIRARARAQEIAIKKLERKKQVEERKANKLNFAIFRQELKADYSLYKKLSFQKERWWNSYTKIRRRQWKEYVSSKYQRINKFSTEIKNKWLYTSYPNAPSSWLRSMLFNKQNNKALMRTQKGSGFYTGMNDSVFEAMSKSASPGRVLWNTLWLHKRVNYTKPYKRLIKPQVLSRNRRTARFNLEWGIRKYQQINRKW